MTREDKIRNELIREYNKSDAGFAGFRKKIPQRRLKWYGYLTRRRRTHTCEERAGGGSNNINEDTVTESIMKSHVPLR